MIYIDYDWENVCDRKWCDSCGHSVLVSDIGTPGNGFDNRFWKFCPNCGAREKPLPKPRKPFWRKLC